MIRLVSFLSPAGRARGHFSSCSGILGNIHSPTLRPYFIMHLTPEPMFFQAVALPSSLYVTALKETATGLWFVLLPD